VKEKRWIRRFGVKSKTDVFVGFLIWVIGPVMLFIAFGQAVQQPTNGFDITF